MKTSEKKKKYKCKKKKKKNEDEERETERGSRPIGWRIFFPPAYYFSLMSMFACSVRLSALLLLELKMHQAMTDPTITLH